ncbi:hypothetical protein K488DRAFT_82798 [Vararia minispora EC-137]|uniref:Uncharacterized protein n=1 Tax=Vararia minispora EC-137 TaxID=1314806 RepID=A0ACB8QVW0_9AGAM|nr:hypothetical protein K488DRAFT_82798 [Vararia minispora EC-137]
MAHVPSTDKILISELPKHFRQQRFAPSLLVMHTKRVPIAIYPAAAEHAPLLSLFAIAGHIEAAPDVLGGSCVPVGTLTHPDTASLPHSETGQMPWLVLLCPLHDALPWLSLSASRNAADMFAVLARLLRKDRALVCHIQIVCSIAVEADYLNDEHGDPVRA